MDLEKETGRTARTFFSVMKEQPLSLALVIMNFTLLFFMFYHQTNLTEQRRQTAQVILENQRQTEILLSKCSTIDMEALIKAILQSKDKEK
jgi:hypothetical protein